MKKVGYSLLALLAVTMVLYIACDLGVGEVPETGSLKVIMHNDPSLRTIAPDISMEVAAYRLSGYRAGSSETIDPVDITATTHTFSGIRVGDWTIIVEALNDDTPPLIIGEGSSTVSISSGTNTNTTVTIVPLSGTGDFSFSLDWSGNLIGNPGVEAYLTHETGSTQTAVDESCIVISGSTATITVEDLESGYYDFSYILKDGETPFAGNFHEVRILSGHTSSASEIIPVSPFEISLSIINNLRNPFAVSITSEDIIMERSSVQSFTAAPADATSYQWYLDGIKIAGAVEMNVLLDGEEIAFGWHTLSVKVTSQEGGISSESIAFYLDDVCGIGGYIDLWFTNKNDPDDTWFFGLGNGPAEGSGFDALATYPEYSIPIHLEMMLEKSPEEILPGSFMFASSVPFDLDMDMNMFPYNGSMDIEGKYAALGVWEVDTANVVLGQAYDWSLFTVGSVDEHGVRRTFDAISNFYNPVEVDNPDGVDDVLKWGKLWETINEGITITFTKYGDSHGSYVKGTVSGTAVSVIPEDPLDPDDMEVLGVYTVSGDFITTRGTWIPPVVQ